MSSRRSRYIFLNAIALKKPLELTERFYLYWLNKINETQLPLRCADNTYYTGVTSNLDKRLIEHHSSEHPNSYTSKRLPVELVFYSEFTDINIAIIREKQVKNWSRAKKEALITGEFAELPNLAKKKFKK